MPQRGVRVSRAVPGLIFALLVGIAASAEAEVVELKTGQRIEGALQEVTAINVVIEVGGQRIIFERGKVRAIFFGAAPSPSSKIGAGYEAVTALRALQSVTTSEISYRDYSPRVLDAKVVVDRYLAEREGRDDSKRAIATAMRLYSFVAAAWNIYISRGAFESLPRDPILAECPQALGVAKKGGILWEDAVAMGRRRAAAPGANKDDIEMGLLLGSPESGAARALWSCAAAKTD